jgi:parallel beta-helix repeat protein
MISSVARPLFFLHYMAGVRTLHLSLPVVLCMLPLMLWLYTSPASAVPPLASTNYPFPPGAFFVSPTGSDANPGTASEPLLTLGKAVATAPSRATIVLRAGVYRESVTIRGKRLTLQPYPHEQVWMKGSVAVTGWVAEGTRWRKDGWTYQFIPTQDSATIDPAYPMARYPDQVFLDGLPLRQVATKTAVVSGTFFVDYTTHQLYIGDDPDGRVVEGSAYALALNIEAADGTVVRGLGFLHYAPRYEPDQAGMVRGNSNALTFEKNTFAYSAGRGLVVYGTDAIVKANRFLYNGVGGLGGYAAHRAVVEGNYVAFSNQEHFKLDWDANGVKLTASDDVLWRENIIEYNLGSALWCDWTCHNNIFVRNVLRHNRGAGIYYEKSGSAVIASNLIYQNQSGIFLTGANRVNIYNNTLANNAWTVLIEDDDRRTGDPMAPGISRDNVMKNNLLSAHNGSRHALLHVDDYTDTKAAEVMLAANDYNAYYRPSAAAPVNVISWDRGLVGELAHYTSLAAFVSANSPRESRGLGIDNQTTNPFFIDEPNGNYRLKVNSPAKGSGEGLPADIADAVNAGLATPVVTVGAPVDRGALAWPELGATR